MAIIINRTLTQEEKLALAQRGKVEADIASQADDFLNHLLRQEVKLTKHDIVKDKTIERLKAEIIELKQEQRTINQ